MDNSINQNSNDAMDSAWQEPQTSSSPTPIQTPITTTLAAPIKKKKFDWLIPVAIVIGVICIAIGVIWRPYRLFFDEVAEVSSTELQLRVGDLTLSYPDLVWLISEQEDNGALTYTILSGVHGSIVVAYVDSGGYYGNSDEIVAALIGSSFDSSAKAGEITINGVNWNKMFATATVDGVKYKFQLYSCTGNRGIYIIGYKSIESTFANDLSFAESVISTIKIEDGKAGVSSSISSYDSVVSNPLVGEWDWGNGGYAVINSDGTMLVYQDSTKNHRNVFGGTYKFSDKVETASGSYLSNAYRITLTIDEFWENGESISGAIGKQNIFIFTPNTGGYYDVYNYRTDSYNRAIRVK